MKKIIGVLMALMCAMLLSSCFDDDESTTSAQQGGESVVAEESQEGGQKDGKRQRSRKPTGDKGSKQRASSGGRSITRADGSKIRTGGYKPSAKAAASAPQYAAKISASELPPKVDLRKYMTQVESQGDIGSCVANATAGAYEYLLNRRQGLSDYDVSRLFLYYNSRAITHEENEDSGTRAEYMLQTLNQQGVCSEATWPYVENKFTQKPSSQAYTEALNNRITKYESVPTDLNTWKSVLAEGYPIIFAMTIKASFQNPRNGHISMPKSNERNDGGHAMCCVGYSDPDQCFIVRNSWGHQWGDGGYCYIPYSLLMSDANFDDSWVIYDVNPINTKDAEDAWSEDSESIFVDINNEFTKMSDETWQAMCQELGKYDVVYCLGALYNIACWADENLADEEAKLALDKLKKILVTFGMDYSPKKVMKHCENLWVNEDDDFFERIIAILSKYLSEGARATIAGDMLEICNADGDAAERDLILGLVGEWLNEDLILEYYADYLDEDEYDDYDDYDEEEDYDYYYGDDDDDDYYYDDDDGGYYDDDYYYDDDDGYYDDDDGYYDDDDGGYYGGGSDVYTFYTDDGSNPYDYDYSDCEDSCDSYSCTQSQSQSQSW